MVEFGSSGWIPTSNPPVNRSDPGEPQRSTESHGSIPELGIPLQSLMIGTFIGGAADSFTPPNFAARNVTGGGSSTLSLALGQALDFDPATPWLFTVVVRFGFQPPPLKDDEIVNTSQSVSHPVPEPLTAGMLGVGVAILAIRRPRGR